MSMQPPPDADEPLDREERELAALYRHLPRAEPDAALDARILADARNAVMRRPRRYRSLLLGFGSAATLVMAAGLTWHIYGRVPGTPPGSPAPVAAHKPIPGDARGNTEVVPVRILSERKKHASNDALKLMQAVPPTAERAQASSGVPAPKAMAAVRASAKATGSAPFLIEQARQALAQEDEARARMLVHEFVSRYPNLPLPPDLVRLKPPGDRPGSP